MAADPHNEPRHFYSLDEYFALEHAGDARYEYWDGDIVCMSGGTEAHGRIGGNVFYRLRQRLEGGPCLALTGDVAVKTPTLPPYRYPDATVACGDLKFQNVRGVDALINPIVIVEVLSPTTALHDREDKFTAYKAIPTFREYLLIAQDAPQITHYIRQEDGLWLPEEVSDAKARLSLGSIGISLSPSELYEGVTFTNV
ncbi:MAG TPA: Uma2 family endonuclease [Blastocatellia bacterium]|nr:Uma2 family endonuclease [Blastocatellia bacterium]